MRKENVSFMGGLMAAGVGSVCCAGPVLLAGLGFGAGAVSFVRDIGFLDAPLLILAGLLFGWSYSLRYRRKAGPGADGETCETVPDVSRKE